MTLRPVLIRIGTCAATIAALVLFVFLLAWIAGFPDALPWLGGIFSGNLGISPSNDDQTVLSSIVERLSASVELLAASLAIAVPIGAALAIALRRAKGRTRAILAILVKVPRWAPYFWVVMIGMIFFAVLLKQGFVGGIASKDSFDLGDRLQHLVEPAAFLSLIQIPVFVACSIGGVTFGRLASAFAGILPEVFGATAITEILFAWPGVGRIFWNALQMGDSVTSLGIVVFGGVVVAVVRSSVAADA